MKDPTFELIEMMFQLSRQMKEEMSFSNDIMQLSALQIQTLMFLNHHMDVTMSDIAKYFRIELPSATSLLNKLYKKELVKRIADESDRRRVKITLSDQGKSMLEEVISQRKKKLEKALAYLSEQEKNDLLSILSSLRGRLQK